MDGRAQMLKLTSLNFNVYGWPFIIAPTHVGEKTPGNSIPALRNKSDPIKHGFCNSKKYPKVFILFFLSMVYNCRKMMMTVG